MVISTSNLLSVSNLSCARGDRVLFSGANFSVGSGEALYVTGVNGAGKTSFLRLVCGLAAPEFGDVLWNGESVRTLREEFARDLLFLGHAAALKDELSAVENLIVSAAVAGSEISETQARHALRTVGLRGREFLPAKVLSAGQRRKVNLARLHLPSPPALWVLDEPFTALDVDAISLLAETVVKHLQSGGMLIYTTHQDVKFEGCLVRRATISAAGVTIC